MRQRWTVTLVTAIALLFPVAAKADDLDELRSEIEAMKETIKQQNEMIGRLSAKDVDRIHKEEMAKLMEEILEDATMQPALPSWLENLKFFGDLRLRYEHQSRGWRDGGYLSHTDKDRNRLRFRLRFGFKKTWWDGQMEIGARFASGSSSANDSTNQSFDGGFTEKPFWIDRAYAKYKPEWAEGLTIAGGKVSNPIRTATKITWDSDINPEGLYVDYEMPFFEGVTPWAQVGMWILEEGRNTRDTTLWNYTLGADVDIADTTLSVGGTYYDFDHTDRLTAGPMGMWSDPNDLEFPQSYAQYQVIELTGSYKWKMLGLPWKVWGSWLQNCQENFNAYRSSSTPLPPGVPPAYDSKFEGEDYAWGIGMKVGTNKKAGDWSVAYRYSYIGLHAWPGFGFGGLSDSDFGGPNTRGHVIGGKYSIDTFMQLCPTILITEPIMSPWATRGEDHSVTVQVDFKWKF